MFFSWNELCPKLQVCPGHRSRQQSLYTTWCTDSLAAKQLVARLAVGTTCPFDHSSPPHMCPRAAASFIILSLLHLFLPSTRPTQVVNPTSASTTIFWGTASKIVHSDWGFEGRFQENLSRDCMTSRHSILFAFSTWHTCFSFLFQLVQHYTQHNIKSVREEN